MKLTAFQIDTFTDRMFGGNPAVVVLVPDWPDDAVLGAIAREHNISTVAFLRVAADGFDIRYVLPIGEVPLVGHASLAAAYVLLRILQPTLGCATLRRRAGTLHVSATADGGVAITLPATPARPCAPPEVLTAALGLPVMEVHANDAQYFAVLEDEAAVARVAPDMDGLMRLDRDGVVVTAAGSNCDFVSRAFAPKEGLPEDPVCGSAHLALVPYWSARLGKDRHRAVQLSPRGGVLDCALDGDQVRLSGGCTVYMEGTINL